MKHTQRFKTILASFLVVAALSTPAVVLSSEEPPRNAELYVEGAGLEVMADGSVQAIFNVSMDRISNCTELQFYLFYNSDYLTPSYIADDGKGHTQNQVISDGLGVVRTDDFFRVDKELYGKKDDSGKLINPFQYSAEGNKTSGNYYSRLDGGKKHVHMVLALDKTRLGSKVEIDENDDETVINGLGPGGKIKMLHSSDNEDETLVSPVINHEDAAPEKVVLGQLSFRVEKENMPKMLSMFRDFRDGKMTEDPYYKNRNDGDRTFLLRVAEVSDADSFQDPLRDDPWVMYTETAGDVDRPYGPKGDDEVHRNAAVGYRFMFEGKTAVDVELANPAFTINAYQNYTNADVGDIALSLGRYSPMATVTYADGTRESFVVSWGRTTVSGVQTEYDPGLGGNAYDPTGGHFLPSQKLVLERDRTDWRGQKVLDGAGKPIRENYAFPTALVADMTVTPITLVDITAPDLERSYTVRKAVQEVESGEKLALPTQARLLTDIVPSGVSLVMPIPGWSPTQADSSWPVADGTNERTLMNSLKADDYSAATGTPYWPDDDDDQSAVGKYRGSYTFQMAESYGGTLKPAYAEAEIDAAYPWLTTPDEVENPEIYRLDNAVRRIVGDDQYTDAALYVAKYEGTTEENQYKPIVTFSVKKKANGTMLDTSVFRVWLPDGTELGTGLTTTGLAAADVEDWFHYATGDLTEQGQPEIKSEGSYEALATENTTNNTTYFTLTTNTGDPTVPALGGAPTDDLREEWAAQQAMREKLRRYINLGGWFTISVSEDPETMTWSEAMPVYVEPRTNVYLQSKEYNFLGENADLLRFPTPVANKITVPHGSYTAVDEKGNPLYDNGGLPDTESVGANQVALSRWREEYGLEILYDGQTGAQPGMLYKLTVDNAQKSLLSGDNSWWDTTIPQPEGRADGTTVAGADIFRYGPAPLYHGALYEAMGYVYQGSVPITSEVPAVPNEDSLEMVVLRRERGKERERVWEEVVLTSEEPTGITTVLDEHNHSNVSLATYDTVMEGYQVRQDYTFTLTNVGTTTIYGLGIDGLTDGYPEEEKGGRFEMLQPPADYLAPGQSTTFVLTYVYNLEANKKTDFIAYRDTLYITSDNHPEGGKDKVRREDYLLDFDAEIAVSDSPLHRVELLVYPNEGTNNPSVSPEDPNYKNDPYPMGTADIIVGEQRGTTPSTMSYTSATRSYSEGQTVYVLVEPKDEYQFNITCVDAATKKDIVIPSYEVAPLDIPEVLGDAKLAKGKKVYCFTMPDEDATVTVRFWEDVFSKLRLTDLIDFSAGTEDALKETTEKKELKNVSDKAVAPENTFKVWRKSFTVDELDAAADFSKTMNTSGSPATSGREDANADMYLMSKGKAIPKDEGGQQFISSENHYIVVIPSDAAFDLSQVQATLRSIVVDRNGLERDPKDPNVPLGYLQENENIPVEVTMARYSSNYMDPDSGYTQSGGFESTGEPYHKTVYQPTNGYAKPTAGAADAPDKYLATHVSNTFDSPEPGTSCYVRVRVQGTSTEGGTSATVYRHYYLEIHRAPEDPEAELNYGNSPFGMIMNDPGIGDSQKSVAKEGFLKNNYSFKGLKDRVPAAVTNSTMKYMTYWREAWVKNRQVYEPESFTGQVQARRPITQTQDSAAGEGGTAGEGETPGEGETTQDEYEYYMEDIPDVYDAKDNLDLSDSAYFAILGEDIYEPGLRSARDSSGRPVDVTKVRVSATVTRLDTGETTQIKRFSGTETAVLDLGWSAKRTYSIAGTGSIPDDGKNYWPMTTTTSTDEEGKTTVTHTEVTDIRPGRYKMVYTYTDFDGVSTLSVTRDFVILSPLGDVNVDLTRDCEGLDTDAGTAGAEDRSSDEYVLKNRIRDPLGYEAQIYTRKKTGQDGAQYTEEVYPYANIFKFRVCDVNNDRNVNNIDGNLINQNVLQSDEEHDEFNRFYDPVKYGLY